MYVKAYYGSSESRTERGGEKTMARAESREEGDVCTVVIFGTITRLAISIR